MGFTVARDESTGAQVYPELEEAEARLAYFYRTLDRLATVADDTSPGEVVAPADQTVAVFKEAMDDDFNTAAAVGQLYDAFVLANKLLDDAKAAPKDVRRRTLARLRRDLNACGETLGIFRREPSAFLNAYRHACAPGGSTRPPSRARRRPAEAEIAGLQGGARNAAEGRPASPSAPRPESPRTSPAPTTSARPYRPPASS